MIVGKNIKIATIYGCLVVVVIAMLLQIWALNKGLILSDAGWFACLLRDHPKDLVTQFQLLFGAIIGKDILASRVLAFGLRVLGAIILSIGAVKYIYSYRKHVEKHTLLAAFCFIYVGQIGLGVNTLEYSTLSLVIGESALGFILIGLGRKSPIFLFFAGIIVWFIVPVKITASLIIPSFCLLILLLSTSKKWRDLLLFICGTLMGAGLFFSFVISLQDFFANFVHQTSATIERGDNDYGILFLFEWAKEAFVYYAYIILISYAIFSFIKQHCDKHISIKNGSDKLSFAVLLIAVFCFALFLIWSGFFPLKGKTILKPFFLFWVLAWVVLFQNNNSDEIIISLLLLLMPALLGFGSDSAIYAKPHFVPFITLSIWFNIKDNKQLVCFFGIVLLCLYSLIQGEFLKRDWFGNKWLEQTEDVRQLGINQHIKLDHRNYDMLQKVLDYTSPGDSVISDMFSWGLVYLADLKPVSHSFRMDTEKAYEHLQQSIDQKQTIILIMLTDTESDKGSKESLLNHVKEFPEVEEYEIGYHRVLIRYSSDVSN